MYVPRHNLPRSNQTSSPNNHYMFQLIQFRAHHKKKHLVLLPYHGLKNHRIPPGRHNNNRQNMHYIEYPYLLNSLQSKGLLSNKHRDIVDGPSSLLGIKNWSLYGTQGYNHIPALMNLEKSNRITENHLRESIEAHKLGICCLGSLLSNKITALTKCTTK